jgi:hypothetical protein
MVREHKLNTVKTKNEIQLIEEIYQNNPFETWKNNFHLDNKKPMLIASIPFVRNLTEYTGNEDNYIKLTSLLHFKEDTSKFMISDLEIIFKDTLIDQKALVLPDKAKAVIDLVFEQAEIILLSDDEIIELENKIVLAIASRLKAEQFIVAKINDDAFWKSISKNQTLALIERYKKDFANETRNIEILEQVNLMTPENIHVNSFMYEPILDMSNDHLKNLYKDIKDNLN